MTAKSLIALGTLIFSISAHAYHEPARDNLYNSLSLAIQAFNPDHSKNLEIWGPEHRFMYDMLLQFDVLRPDLKQIGRTEASESTSIFHRGVDPAPYREVGYKFPVKYQSVPPAEVDAMEIKIIDTLKAEQAVIRSTETYTNYNDSQAQSKTVSDARVWTNIAFPRDSTFEKLGYDGATVIKEFNSWSSTSNSVSVVFKSKLPRDMVFAASQLKQVPVLKFMAPNLIVSKEERNLDEYRERKLGSMKPDRNKLGETGGYMEVIRGPSKGVFALKLSYAWCSRDDGDCWGQGKFRHNWYYEVHAKAAAKGEGIGNLQTGFAAINTHFDFKLKSENGPAPLKQKTMTYWE